MKEIISLCTSAGIKNPVITRLKGDMSERKIFRVKYGSSTLIAVSSRNIPENSAFLSFRDTFEANGFSVPYFIAGSKDMSTYLIEDLGDVTVKSYCDEMIRKNEPDAVKDIYKIIITELAKINSALYDKIDYSKCYQGDTFVREAMEKDVSRFRECFLGKYHGRFDKVKFEKFSDAVLSEADAQNKTYFMYRDFQTRNIMVKDRRLYFIDFQSGRKGSFFYDLASFIYSSNTIRYEGIENELSRIYLDLQHCLGADIKEFEKTLEIFGCLRIMQALGNYAYYYYTRDSSEIENKKKTGLENLLNLSLSLDLETGIIPDIYR